MQRGIYTSGNFDTSGLPCKKKEGGGKRASVTRSEETNYFGESDKVV